MTQRVSDDPIKGHLKNIERQKGSRTSSVKHRMLLENIERYMMHSIKT